ncbi:SET and MYND domain-containing protein 4 [Musca vetustissima]|uniref:SET and MYND domain-containing protein 4 n=1 Tax=Musca vetustissima TaxID=27455 RepID=UPI002AB5ED5F|nr:SET and MYND domain-containing protein 4 [Musca vetustissima]
MSSTLGEKNYFASYYVQLKNSIEHFDEEVEKIGQCKNDLERVHFVENFKGLNEGQDEALQIRREFRGKSAAIALDFKEKGNMAFKAQKWLEAMVLYTKSYVALPEDNVNEKSIILANRSAALYHLEKYDEAMIDIKRSLDYGYPKDLLYKLYERLARCYMAKKDYPNTIKYFKLMITSMDDAKNLPATRKSQLNTVAMTMIKMLERDPRTNKQMEIRKKKGLPEEVPLSLAIADEKEFISEAIRFDENRCEGRFVRAATDVKVGDEILVEKPFVAVLLEKFAKTHCENCFIRTAIPVACPKCADVVYCSEKCQKRAAKSYHKYECGILPTIWSSGASVNCHMALRILTSRSMDHFLEVFDKIDDKLTADEIQKIPKDDYRRIAHLVRHEDERTASNFFQHALMARFLTKCLKAVEYFGENPKAEDILKIESIALRNLQFLQFNTHEVAELHKSQTDGSEKTAFIGGALYPTLALFNHSCDPSVVRYYRGTTIHINMIKPVEAGLQICENYGPIYTQETRNERQAKLKDLYKFECCCDACLENWPTFDKLPTDVIRFRCDAPNKCNAVIEVPPNCNDFMVKCLTCNESTNILKGLKVMQDTEMMTRTAKRLYDTGDYSKALNKYVDLIKIMSEVLAPPFPDYCQCQQFLKDCFLHLGNFYNLD